MAFFVHLMPLIYNTAFFIVPDPWNVSVGGKGWD
jgi:hypothetical protein